MRTLYVLLLIVALGVPAGFAQEQAPVVVGVEKIREQKIEGDQVFLGVLYFERVTHISSEVSGLVKKLDIRQGQRVKEGGFLISLDTQLLDKEITIHKNQLELGRLRIAHLEKKFSRMQSLYEKGSASEMLYDDARYALDDAQLKQMSTQDQLEKLFIRKQKSMIQSPFDGIVLEKYVDVGGWVSPGKILADIASVDDLFVKVPVSENLIKYIPVGTKVKVRINAYGRNLSGKVEGIFPAADEKTKNVFLKIRIPMLKQVALNMSATVEIPASEAKSLFIIPRDALVTFRGKNFVYVINKGKAVVRGVNIVSYLDKNIGVDNSHFKAGMTVVVDGNERLRPGQPVKITGGK